MGRDIVFVLVNLVSVVTAAVSVSVAVAMPVAVVGRCEEPARSVVVGGVREDTILDVATEEALLGERHSILKCIVPPTVHPAEEEGSAGLARHVLIQVVLEELPLSSRFHS